MATADIAALWDILSYNSGFVAVKPTNISKRLYQVTKSIANNHTGLHDQYCLNKAIKILRQKKVGLKIVRLNTERFLNGLQYFEERKCDQMNQSKCACVVHNN